MKLKRVTALALSLVLLFALTSCGLTTTTGGLACKLNSNRRSYTVEGYAVCENGCYDPTAENYNIEDCTCHPTEITIDHYKKWPVSTVGSGAFENCKHLQVVNFGSLVEYIESAAFSGCTSITAIALPEGLRSIGAKAFFGCTGVMEISIPGTVKEIGNEAFSGCTGVTVLTIGDGVESIGASVFKGCEDISGTVVIPDSVTKIGSEAFSGCKGITTIVLSSNVTEIGAQAFAKCDKLTKIYYTGALTAKERNELFGTLKTGKDDGRKVSNIVYSYSESEPTESGRFWHYVNGEPIEW